MPSKREPLPPSLKYATEAVEALASRGLLRFNELLDAPEWSEGSAWHEIDDAFLFNVRRDVEALGGRLGRSDGLAAVTAVAKRHSTHPVKRWLSGLDAWDRTPRVARLLGHYFQALGDQDRLADASIAWAVGAIHRLVEPGCRLTSMPMSVERSPIEAVEALVGSDWCAHSPGGSPHLPAGCWCVIVDVRGGYSDATHWLRRRSGRPVSIVPWGWCPRVPRGFADDRYVEYRSWIAPLVRNVEADREQLWAEALHLYESGTRPASLPPSISAWNDPLAPTVLKWIEARARFGKLMVRRDLLLACGLHPQHDRVGSYKRLDGLAKALYGATLYRCNKGFAYRVPRGDYRTPHNPGRFKAE